MTSNQTVAVSDFEEFLITRGEAERENREARGDVLMTSRM